MVRTLDSRFCPLRNFEMQVFMDLLNYCNTSKFKHPGVRLNAYKVKINVIIVQLAVLGRI